MKNKLFFLLIFVSIFYLSISLVYATNPPSNFNATPASSCSVDFSWGTASTIDYYEIRSTSSPTFFGGLGDLVATTTNFLYKQNGLNPNTSLNYRIRAYKNPDYSTWEYPSISPTVTPPTNNIPPEPNNLIASARDTGGTIEINWTGQGGSISSNGGIEIQRALNTDTYTTAEILNKDTSFYVDNGFTMFGNIDNTRAYKYRIRNFDNDDGCSTNLYSGYTNDVVIPPVPRNLSTTYVYNPSNPPIDLTWDVSEAATYYDIYESTSTNPFIKIGQQSGATFSKNNPEKDQEYNYYIVACSNNVTNTGCSASSTVISISVTNVPQKFSTRIFRVNDNSADIEYSFKNTFAPSFPDYDIHRKTQGVFNPSNKINSLGGSGDSNKIFEGYDNNIQLGKVYQYGVRAKFGGNNFSDFSTNLIDTRIDKVLQGAAWSGYTRDGTNSLGVGWIILNSDFIDAGGTKIIYSQSKFSVQIDRNGLFSGIAWASAESSSNNRGWGWISFNQSDLIGCPDNPLDKNISDACSAKLINGNEVRGWARFISANNPSSSFSGWISLNSKTVAGNQRAFLGSKKIALRYLNKKIMKSPDSYTLSNVFNKVVDVSRSIFKEIGIYTSNAGTYIPYGVTYDNSTKRLSGEAWGGDPLIGWISFGGSSCPSCSASVIEKNSPPVISNIQLTEATMSEAGETNRSGAIWCARTPKYKITWKYTDTDGDLSKSAQIIFKRQNGTQIYSTLLADKIVSSGSTVTYYLLDPITRLGQNQTFKVSVKMSDSNNTWSNEIVSNSKRTPKHYYSLVDFTWVPNPAPINIGSTEFHGTSTDRSGGEWAINSWQWTFPNANPSTVSTQIATSTFFATSTNPVNLMITDSNNNSCSIDYYNVASSTRKFKRIFKEL